MLREKSKVGSLNYLDITSVYLNLAQLELMDLQTLATLNTQLHGSKTKRQNGRYNFGYIDLQQVYW